MSLCGTDYAIGAVRNMYVESRSAGTMVTMPSKLSKGLPRRTGSLCPECLKVIPATLYIGDGALKMKKTCKEHYEFAVLRAQRPIPVTSIQFAGGEPTIYPQFPEIVKASKEMGFGQVQVATNGIRIATEEGFLDKVSEAGLNTIYLQFDGLREENYIQARGRPLLDIKLKVIEKAREMDKAQKDHPTACPVPTLA